MSLATPRGLFRVAAIAEAITWTLLITALIVRAATGFTLGVTIAGGIHGFVFLSYGATAVLVAVNQRWHLGVAALAIGSAVIPYATIPTELWLDRTGRLGGAWRREAATGDGWTDAALRWFLRNPVVLTALLAVAVAGLFVVLLTVGPPGGEKS